MVVKYVQDRKDKIMNKNSDNLEHELPHKKQDEIADDMIKSVDGMFDPKYVPHVVSLTTKQKRSDIYLVAAWMSHGANLVSVDRSDPRHILFEVEGENLKDLEQEWINGSLFGNLITFSEKLRSIRVQLHVR